MIHKNTLFFLICGVTIMVQGCKKTQDLNSLSPREAADLYIKACSERNTELLRKIIFFPPEMSEEEIEKMIGPSSQSKEAKGAERLMRAAGAKVTSEYEKLLSEGTAEVGIIMKFGIGPVSKRMPGDQFIMKKEEDVWKYHYARGDLTQEQLMQTLQDNPNEAWAYYRLGMKIKSENPYKACKLFQKYYNLEPKGFWVDSELLWELKALNDPASEEQELLKSLYAYPKNTDGRLLIYIRLGQLFIEVEDSKKAQWYLQKAEAFIKKKRKLDPYLRTDYEKTQEKLANLLEGKSSDPLDELLE